MGKRATATATNAEAKAEPLPKKPRKSTANKAKAKPKPKAKSDSTPAENFRNQPLDPQAAEFWNNFRHQAQAQAPVPKDRNTPPAQVDAGDAGAPMASAANVQRPQATQPQTEVVEVAATQLEMAEGEVETKKDHAVAKASTKDENPTDLPASSSAKKVDLDLDMQTSPQCIDYTKPPEDLNAWFSQDGVLGLEAELERAKQHPLFAKHSAEVLEEVGEDFVWGSEEGDPLADLEYWLKFVVDKEPLEHGGLSAEDEQYWHSGLLSALATASKDKRGRAGQH